MSGICGIVRLDGGTPSPAEIAPMCKVLQRRGPDGTATWVGECAALGHTSLVTTPEALVERLPLTHAESGCAITADARLDNREELLATLGLAGETRVIGDGELILLSYLRWGEDCPKHLLGDFAFAIWDERAQQLFCARDHMGMRQLLYYRDAGRLFVFGTEAQAVLTHRSVPQCINEERIADFLEDLEGIDLPSTFFEDVHRLPPAHFLTVNANGATLQRYWQLRPNAPLMLGSDQAYADAFLDVFTEAVRCRLRRPGPVGSMLSGGMDSGSVAAVAARLLSADGGGPLHTFSAVGPDPETCIETRTILSASSLPGLAARFVNLADMDTYRHALMDLPKSGEPFDFHMTLIRAVYMAAHQQGIKIMLDGVGGDVVMISGNRVGQLLRAGRIVAAVREARGEGRFWGPLWPWWKSLAHGAWAAWVPNIVRNFRGKIHARRSSRTSMVAPEFANSIDLAGRRQGSKTVQSGGRFSVEKRRQSILHPHLTAARERYDRVASANAIEPRDPFMDVRLIQFCLSLPVEQLQSDGWRKLVLRRAMHGLLPDTVVWRVGKEHLGWAFTLSLFDGWEGWSGEVEAGKPLLRRFVRADLLEASNQRQGKALDREQQFKLFFLLNWLRRSGMGCPDATPMLGKRHVEENA
jgi:asparagine synthase (glutamine-hydrolysing)